MLPSTEFPEDHPINERELKKFFQTWIFFGLLHELMHKYGLYDEADYLENDNHGTCMHTKRLAERLQCWENIVGGLESGEKVRLYDHLASCLNLASGVVYRGNQKNALEPDFGHEGFNKAIIWSLAGVCETIAYTLRRALIEPGESGPVLYWGEVPGLVS